VEQGLRRPDPVTVGYVLKETIEKSPDLVQAYVNVLPRPAVDPPGQDEEITDLL
jgi:hypothetical protein